MKQEHINLLTMMETIIKEAQQAKDFEDYVEKSISKLHNATRRGRQRAIMLRQRSTRERYELWKDGLYLLDGTIHHSTVAFLEKQGCIQRVHNDYGYDFHRLIKTTY